MFHLSTKSRYGLRALIELAALSKVEPVSLKKLAINQDISKKYLENIFRMLQKDGIIRSIRGAHGGYLLAEPPEKISVYRVLKAIDGPVNLLDCISDTSLCGKARECPTRPLWTELEQTIVDFLESKTLKDLLEKFRKAKKSFRGMYI